MTRACQRAGHFGPDPVAHPPYALIATLHFDSLDAIKAAFASPEGRAAAADVRTFATGGVDMLLFDTRDV